MTKPVKTAREIQWNFIMNVLAIHHQNENRLFYTIDEAILDSLAQLEEYYKPKLLEKRDIEKKIITCPECNHTWAIAIIRGDK